MFNRILIMCFLIFAMANVAFAQKYYGYIEIKNKNCKHFWGKEQEYVTFEVHGSGRHCPITLPQYPLNIRPNESRTVTVQGNPYDCRWTVEALGTTFGKSYTPKLGQTVRVICQTNWLGTCVCDN